MGGRAKKEEERRKGGEKEKKKGGKEKRRKREKEKRWKGGKEEIKALRNREPEENKNQGINKIKFEIEWKKCFLSSKALSLGIDQVLSSDNIKQCQYFFQER